MQKVESLFEAPYISLLLPEWQRTAAQVVVSQDEREQGKPVARVAEINRDYQIYLYTEYIDKSCIRVYLSDIR